MKNSPSTIFILIITFPTLLLSFCKNDSIPEGKETPVNANNPAPITIYEKNPFFWEYDREPVFLIGGSVEDNLFQVPKLEEHLDLLQSVGGNYIRCTMSSRDEGNVKPFMKKDGLFDLESFNPDYWNKFEQLLRLTRERDIIPQIELWATYDFYNGERSWSENVFNPMVNSSYTSEDSNLPEVIEHNAQMAVNPFFESVPALDNKELVLKYQQKFIDKILSYSLEYNHVLYCIDNETNTHPEWGKYWAKYIRQKAAEEGKTIYITEMWDNWDPTEGQVEGVRRQEDVTHPFLGRSKVSNTINAPELYDFLDISNNNAQNGEVHYQSGLFVRKWVEETGIIRPINNVKIYGGTIYEEWTKDWAGSFKDGEERFWRNLFAGHASVRFHRPPYGIGLNHVAQNHIRSMRMLTDSMDLFHHVPSTHLLYEREPNEAFCLSIPGREYVFYFPGQGSVYVELPPGKHSIRWLHIRSSTWRNPIELKDPLLISTPDNDQWAAFMRVIE